MKGNTQVIAALNELLSNELSAMDQYFIHARMYHDWGLSKLFERIDHEVTDEKAHAAALIERILFLEGTPDLSKRDPLQVGTDVPSMLQNDLNVEYSVGKLLKQMGKHLQVFAITHLPQVAAWGDQHYVVEKSNDGTVMSS